MQKNNFHYKIRLQMYHNQRISNTFSRTSRKLLMALGTLKTHQGGVSATGKFLSQTTENLDRSLKGGVLSLRRSQTASSCTRCLVHNTEEKRNSNAWSCDESFFNVTSEFWHYCHRYRTDTSKSLRFQRCLLRILYNCVF